jgi:hypothetical protein
MEEDQKEKELILEKTAREYFQSGKEEENKGRNNSAVVLFFKSLIALADLHIYRILGKTPSSHGERFTLAKNNLPELYNLLDKDFPFYQDSYNVLMCQEPRAKAKGMFGS